MKQIGSLTNPWASGYDTGNSSFYIKMFPLNYPQITFTYNHNMYKFTIFALNKPTSYLK